jgi:hypothetical protein
MSAAVGNINPASNLPSGTKFIKGDDGKLYVELKNPVDPKDTPSKDTKNNWKDIVRKTASIAFIILGALALTFGLIMNAPLIAFLGGISIVIGAALISPNTTKSVLGAIKNFNSIILAFGFAAHFL